MSNDSTTASFKYNSDGLRVQKTVGSVVTNYTLHGKNIVHMTQGSNSLHFFYDASNKPAIVDFNGTKYAYVHNLQGDIVAILDSAGNIVVQYKYDAWGRPISKTGSLASTLGTVQPFRYRGYVYDEETGGYYLRNRYYEPEWCRFLNADMYISRNLLNNVFAYCASSPVRLIDPKGTEYFDLYDEDADEKRGGYDTADEAAIAFYEEFYPKSMYTLVEYGGKIYSREIEGVTRYFYSQPLIGEIHSVSPIDIMIDNGVSLVALVHTHPSYNGFSEPDYKYSKDHGINFYVVGPNLLVQCYDYMIDKITDIGIIKFQKLTAKEKKFLEKTYRYKWENHFIMGKCYLGYECIESEWPNETY